MVYFRDTTDFHIDGPCAVTLGKFDGIHLGHQKLMKCIEAFSKEMPGCRSVVFSLNVRDEQLILTLDEQRAFLEEMGIDCLIQCPFVPEIYTMTPDIFVRKILKEALGAVCVAVGTDFRFGHKRAGDTAFLQAAASEYGFEMKIVPHERYRGEKISSTFVREALLKGDARLAGTLLGRFYSISGEVVHGTHLGTSMGMPTANIIPAGGKLLPKRGVYVSRTRLDGKMYPSVTNVGIKPTVNGTYDGAETYIYHVDRPLYGEMIEVELLDYFRDEKRFASVEELREQIRKDIRRGEAYFHGKESVLF